MEDTFTGRERSRLRRARESGYLNATCRSREAMCDAHSFWCWRLRLPVVWFERISPRSRYGRVKVDLFTTPNVLSPKGEAELRGLGGRLPVSITCHDVTWPRVPCHQLQELARLALRTALRAGNCELAEATRIPDVAGNVLTWKIPA
ncbi:MAG TPA: hypothetical protein VGF49_06815 [Candidatus Solibacter sp.]